MGFLGTWMAIGAAMVWTSVTFRQQWREQPGVFFLEATGAFFFSFFVTLGLKLAF